MEWAILANLPALDTSAATSKETQQSLMPINGLKLPYNALYVKYIAKETAFMPLIMLSRKWL